MVRIAELGAGIISDCHFFGLASRDDAQIVAIASANEEEGRKACADHPGSVFYTDYKELLLKEKGNIDGVIIALPNFMHYEAAKFAIEQGYKFILCEKPLCNCSSDSRDLMRLVEENNVVFQTAYMKRFNPGFRMIKDKLPELGSIEFINGHIYCSDVEPESEAAAVIYSWHGDAEKSGGGFLNHSGSHHFDLFHFIFGDIEWARANVRYIPGTKRDYYMKGNLHTLSGHDIEYHLGRMDVPNLGPGQSVVRGGWDECIMVMGTRGFIKCENPTWQGFEPEKVTMWIKGMPGPQTLYLECKDQWTNELGAFVQAIKEGKLHPDATDCMGGYKVDYLIEKIKESGAQNGAEIRLNNYGL